MVDGVEGCGAVEEDEDINVTNVGGKQEVISDAKESYFNAVVGSELLVVRWVLS